jgi:MFS family permease
MLGRREQMKHDLRSSVGDAACAGVMVGTGETYLPAFVLAGGLGEVVAGLVASLPQLAGGITQLISPRGVRWLGSHRRWVVACAFIQAMAFVPLAIAAARGTISAWLALGAATLYWSAGLASNPPWNAWMGTIVPPTVRSRYFARRTRVQQATVLTGFLLSGAAIQFGATAHNALAGYSILFAMAVACRLGSVGCLASTGEPSPMPPNVRRIAFPVLLQRFSRGAEGQRLWYLSLVQGAAYFAGPYFAPYMFRVLNLSYPEYVVLISTAYMAKVASLSLWGAVAARFGVRKLLWLGGIGIIPTAGLWLLSDRFWYLIVVQLGSGAAWAAYELAVFLIYFNSVRAEERTSVLSLFNLATTTGMVVGALLGGGVLIAFGATRPVYYALFAGSSLLRVGTLFFLRRIPSRLIEGQKWRPRAECIPAAVTVSVRPLIANFAVTEPARDRTNGADEGLRQSA